MKELPPPPAALPRPVADSHCHLDTAREYTALEVDDAIAQAARVGVDRIVQVGCDLESSRWAIALARRAPSVVATVAIHPNDAARLAEARSGVEPQTGLDATLDELERLVADAVAQDSGRTPDSGSTLRGIGETGLDYFRTTSSAGIAAQKRSFARHIAWAHEHDLTLVIHDRDAHADIVDVLDAEGVPERVVMHCFSGDAAFARECLDRGAYLSFPGTVTFKPNHDLREALAITPVDRLLTETDAPFLTPMPFRGHANASYLIPHTVRFMARHLDVELGALCEALAANTSAAFGGDWARAQP